MEAASVPALRFVGHKSLDGPKCFSIEICGHLKSRRITRKSMKSKSRESGRVYCAVPNTPQTTITTAPMWQKTEYKDTWIHKMAIDYLSKCVQQTTGKATDLDGYDGLVDVVFKTFHGFGPIRQRELIVDALHLAIPEFVLNFARTILLPSKITSEYFAFSTPFLFGWLVGHCEIRETEIDGCQQRSLVHIKKCRLLESTNCVGICTNMCKIPSQQFIGEYLGTPMTLTPNFEDMSCELVFGKNPPPIAEDPALSQPCYKICKGKKQHTEKCSGLHNNSLQPRP